MSRTFNIGTWTITDRFDEESLDEESKKVAHNLTAITAFIVEFGIIGFFIWALLS